MATATTSMRKILRTALLAMAILTPLAAGTAPVRANQSGPGVNEIAEFQIALCEVAGGKAGVSVSRTVGSGLQKVYVDCKGGLLGGMSCGTTPFTSSCKLHSAPANDPGMGSGGQGTAAEVEAVDDLPEVTPDVVAEDASPVPVPADDGDEATDPDATVAEPGPVPDEPVIEPVPDIDDGPIADVDGAGPVIMVDAATVDPATVSATFETVDAAAPAVEEAPAADMHAVDTEADGQIFEATDVTEPDEV